MYLKNKKGGFTMNNELHLIFNKKITENGDKAYYSSLNKYIDILFKASYYRHNPKEVPLCLEKNNPKDTLMAMFIRDPRHGMGERAYGRRLLQQVTIVPEAVEFCGRADDLLELGYYDYFLNCLKSGDQLFKKWAPRKTAKQIHHLKELKKLAGGKNKYRELIRDTDTIEKKITLNEEIDFKKVPSLAMLKYHNYFINHHKKSYDDFMKLVKKGEAKINTSVTNPLDIYLYKGDRDLLFNQLPKVDLGSILPIVDNSGSMCWGYGKATPQIIARAIGHYVAKNNTYYPNNIISFSSEPKLITLSDNYESDMIIMNSYDDCSNTDFGKVMKILSELKEDKPNYLLVLSDMEFDEGSSDSKDEAMKKLGKSTRIIWWNLNSRKITFPETDEHGNIFMSGYNPMLLKYLETGFDGNKFIDYLLETYKEKIKLAY